MSTNNPTTSTGTGPLGGASKDVSDLAKTARHDIDEIGEEVKEQAAALGEEAKAQLAEATDKAKSIAAQQKDLLAEQLGGLSGALRKVAGELETSNDSSAGYIRTLADGADRVTSTVRDNDIDTVLSMAQDFGRRQPAAFLGAAALLGFAASRFVMASASRPVKPDGSAAPDYAQSVGGYDAGI
jgi:hypothetical protein